MVKTANRWEHAPLGDRRSPFLENMAVGAGLDERAMLAEVAGEGFPATAVRLRLHIAFARGTEEDIEMFHVALGLLEDEERCEILERIREDNQALGADDLQRLQRILDWEAAEPAQEAEQ